MQLSVMAASWATAAITESTPSISTATTPSCSTEATSATPGTRARPASAPTGDSPAGSSRCSAMCTMARKANRSPAQSRSQALTSIWATSGFPAPTCWPAGPRNLRAARA
jgi:hypothetical protein